MSDLPQKRKTYATYGSNKRSRLSSTSVPSSLDTVPVASTSSTPPSSVSPQPFSAAKPKRIVKSKAKLKAIERKSESQLSQMFLSFSDTASQSLHCSECGMTYMRGSTEDSTLHDKHHKRVMGGIDYPAAGFKSDTMLEEVSLPAVKAVKGKQKALDRVEGKVLCVDGGATGLQAKKMTELMDTIDTELGAESIGEDKRRESKLFLFLSDKGKIIGCVIASRITSAFEVLPSAQADDHALKFELNDSSAIFCSPTAQPALIGISRMWTSTSHRQRGIASKLLQAVAQHFIYARPLNLDSERRQLIAFSQPTESGAKLARSFLGVECGWKVFG